VLAGRYLDRAALDRMLHEVEMAAAKPDPADKHGEAK
jgi:hypothetical protein